jgi:hypothetical protein
MSTRRYIRGDVGKAWEEGRSTGSKVMDTIAVDIGGEDVGET